MSLKEALKYAERGWKVFPLLPRSKAPATTHGFHDAAVDTNAIKSMWGIKTNLNIGIATGDNFWVLDIDAKSGGLDVLESWENKYGSLPETLTSKTGGGGIHLLFKIPRSIKIPSNANKLAVGVDIRGAGGYIAAPPSVHPNGTLYEWVDEGIEIAEAPKWLLKLITDLKNESSITPIINTHTEEVLGDWTTEDVISMLDCVSPDTREDWINVGMALHGSGFPLSMWDTWSRGSNKYKAGEPARIWKGFNAGGGITIGTLIHIAQDSGWTPANRVFEPLDFSNIGGVDLTEFKNNLTAIKDVVKVVAVESKLEISGIVADTVAWINSCSTKLQPELAALHTIVTLGAVFGRRYALQRLDTRTNLYVVAIAESGQGKDNSRNCLPMLLRAAGLEAFSGPETVRSENGLLLELKKQPAFIANIDEFGMFMGAISDPKAATYHKNISTLFTSLFGKSRTFYKDGLTASNPDDRIILNEPHLCIYGTTTEGSYRDAMRRSAINSGKINRFIIFKTPIEFPPDNNESCHSEPPEALVARWAQHAPNGLESAPDIIEQKKTIVMIGETAKELQSLQDFQNSMQKKYHQQGVGDLWVRYRENVIKVGMIIAIARDGKKPVLTLADLNIGKTIVGASLSFMINFAQNSMYDGEFQRMCAKFMEVITSGVTSRTGMIRRLKIKTKELDEIEKSLKEMGNITFNEKDRPREYELLTLE